ncbi:MAG: DUF4406 domain-containing protein [Prevotella sp.]|nr:DUF4406 domain-containing protein [Prevotella sp.]
MHIYLSGPISGHDLETRRLDFAAIQQTLEALGHTVFNPMRNGLPAEASTHRHMHADITALLQCDAIFMMTGWLHSKGCKLEFDVATAIGLSVYFEEAQAIPKSNPIKFK